MLSCCRTFSLLIITVGASQRLHGAVLRLHSSNFDCRFCRYCRLQESCRQSKSASRLMLHKVLIVLWPICMYCLQWAWSISLMPFFLSFLQHSFTFRLSASLFGVFQRPRLKRGLKYLRGSPLDLLDYGHRDRHLAGWNWNQNPLRTRSYKTRISARQDSSIHVFFSLLFDVLDRDLLRFAHLLPRWRPQDVEVQPGQLLSLESLIMSHHVLSKVSGATW